ncbi:class II histone deacetylase [Neisseriaceae bacterium CLB008]|nr:class II histone deacetylase [Neisseriaceae bacterium]
MSKKTGFVWHELYMWHDTGNYAGVSRPSEVVQPSAHYESPEPKRRIKNLLDVTGLTEQLTAIKPIDARQQDLARAHTSDYLASVEAMDGVGGCVDPESPLGASSVRIAKKSAGGAIEAVKAVVSGQVQNAYALIRPPGHHAEPDRGRGFCTYANAAVAGAYALDELGLAKIAFVDWDVHHGNGTEAVFWDDPRALTISLHQDDLYPRGTGAVTDVGGGAGLGANINIPMLPGSGHGAYLYAFEKIVLPALRAFQPDLIIVPCGFDASIEDPLGRMLLHADSYRAMTQAVMAVADELGHGRVVMTHEGGYNGNTTPFLGLAVIETLSGIKTGVQDPLQAGFASSTGQGLMFYQKAWIDELLVQLRQVRHSPLAAQMASQASL